jgi:hypothetical protein
MTVFPKNELLLVEIERTVFKKLYTKAGTQYGKYA